MSVNLWLDNDSNFISLTSEYLLRNKAFEGILQAPRHTIRVNTVSRCKGGVKGDHE